MSNINKLLSVIITYSLLLASNFQCGSKTTTATNITATSNSNGDRTGTTPPGGENGSVPSAHAASATPPQCPDPQADTLNTPLYGQDSHKWCWAASARMVFATLHDTIRQCDMVALTVPTPDCCGGTTPAPCDIEGFPPFSDFNFHADSTERGSALPWEEIQRQIGCLRTPICAKWRWTEGGETTGTNHFVVVVAYQVKDGEQMVTILNPLPEIYGSSRVIPYSEFVQSPDVEPHIHGKDYYNIRKED